MARVTVLFLLLATIVWSTLPGWAQTADPVGGERISWRELTIETPPRWFRMAESSEEQTTFAAKFDGLLAAVVLGAVEPTPDTAAMTKALTKLEKELAAKATHTGVQLVTDRPATILQVKDCPYLTYVANEKRSLVFSPPGMGEGYTVTILLPADSPAEVPEFAKDFLASLWRTEDWQAHQEELAQERLAALAKPIQVPPVKSSPFLEITTLTQAQWDGAVAAAVESVRILQGPMAPEEQAAFENQWAPLRSLPTPEAVEYVNKLSPLLAQFLSLRTAVQESAERVERIMVEAGWAAELDAEVLTRQSFALASRMRTLLLSQQRRLDQVAKQIADLGNPPGGAELVAEGQQNYKRAKDYLRGMLDKPEGLEGIWIGYTEYAKGVPFIKALKREPIIFLLYSVAEPGTPPEDEDYRGLMLEVNIGDDEAPRIWTLDPMPIGELGLMGSFSEDTFRHHVSDEDFEADIFAKHYTGSGELPVYPGASLEEYEQATAAQLAENQRRLELTDDPIESVALTAMAGLLASPLKDVRAHYRLRKPFVDVALAWLDEGALGESVEEDASALTTAFAQGSGTVVAQLEKEEADRKEQEQADKQAQKEAQEKADAALQAALDDPTAPVPLHMVDDKTPEERQAIDTEAVSMHETNIAIITRHMAKDREELKNEKDPTRREELSRRILHATADIQSEQDRIASLKTGTIVHSRSVFDDFAHAQFVQKIAQEQKKMETVRKATETAYRLADTLPEDEARKLRKLADKHLTPDLMANLDDTRAREVVTKLHSMTSNYWLAEKDKAGVDEAWAEASLQTATSIKEKADTTLQYASMVGGKHVYTMYKGATGYIEGGVKEAVLSVADSYSKTTGMVSAAVRGYEAGGAKEAFLRVAGSYNDASMAVVEFYRGFEEAGADGDLYKALSNASWRTVKAVAIDKGTQFVMGKVADRYNNGPKREAQLRKAKNPSKKPSKKPSEGGADDDVQTTQTKPKAPIDDVDDFNRPLTDADVKQYRAQVADARVRVKSLQKTHDKLQKARKAGAPPEEIKTILRELDDRAAKVHASPQAKIMMKNLQGSPKNAELCKRFVNGMDRVHTRVQKRFEAEMQARGFNPQKMKPIRNVGAGKSVNMDYDVAIQEQPWVKDGKFNPWLTKKGKPVSVEAWQLDAQDAWNKAYKAETGQDAPSSFETVTYGKHQEAYSDLDIIREGGGGILDANKKFAEQTGDVSKYKAAHLRDDADLKDFGKARKLVEIARGTAKDSKKKLLKLMDENKPKPGTKAYAHWEKQRSYWGKVTQVLEDMGSMKLSPLEGDRKIRLMTGGKSLVEINQDMGDMLSMAVFLKK